MKVNEDKTEDTVLRRGKHDERIRLKMNHGEKQSNLGQNSV